jgi:DNA-binding transcriptional LysR family regulator
MQLLASLAETGSFAKTAALMNMTPSAISKRIAELEFRLNVRLAVRGADGVTLTDAGRAMARCTGDVLHRLSEMSAEIVQSLSEKSGNVRISANTSALMLGLSDDLIQFRQENAGIRVALSERVSAEVVSDVQGGRADIGICARSAIQKSITAVPYRRCPLVVVVPSDHPLLEQKSVRYQSILAYPNVGRTAGSALAEIAPIHVVEEAASDINVSVHSFDAVIELVRGCGMIALLPSIALERRPAPGVHAIALDEPWAMFEMCVCYDATVLHRPAVLTLFKWLASRTSVTPCGDQ